MQFKLEHAIDVLSRTPRILTVWLSGIASSWSDSNEGEGTWSPVEIVGHLVHGEETDWMPRLEHVLAGREDEPFEPFDRFAMLNQPSVPLTVLLEEFETLRTRNLEKLQQLRLTAADFERRGLHPDLGPVTLGELLATWVAHDLSHLAQISRVMARQYDQEVGPWRAYLPILNRND